MTLIVCNFSLKMGNVPIQHNMNSNKKNGNSGGNTVFRGSSNYDLMSIGNSKVRIGNLTPDGTGNIAYSIITFSC